MLDISEFFCFRDGKLQLVTEASPDEVQLSVADSWLVDNGRSRNIQAHFDRFASWASQISSVEQKELDDFFSAVRSKIPAEGRWFPRIEFHSEAHASEQLFLRLREAPGQLGRVVLWTLPEPDPRIHPTIKGPDLSLGMQMRRKAKMHGADEAVILDPDGYILEGALSSLVWWREDVLCSVSDELPWLPSITRDEVFSIAQQMGYLTQLEKAKPADLTGLEIWALSSLQGIRPVTDWVNLNAPIGEPVHFEAFSKRLRMLSTAIT